VSLCIPAPGLALIFAFTVHSVTAADYPSRPVRILVGAATGGGVDLAARIVAPRLTDLLKQQFVVENRPGAGGNIAAEQAARAQPDGETLLMGTIGNLSINPSLYRDLPFDALRDFAPVSRAADSTNVLVVHPTLPARNVKELVAIARARPGELLYGSAQTGTAGHLAGELFNSLLRVKLVHVPYKGGAPAMVDLIAGQLQLIFATAVTAVPHVKTGRIRALAVTTARRSAIVPDLPTMEEAGIPGFEVNNWYGLVAPAKTPPETIRILNKAMGTLLTNPDVIAIMQKQGLDPAPGTPDAFGAYIKSEITKWARVVQASGAKAD
jgi:tripartite-type tricarboxylate transporter receptor subunit TctC